MRAGLLQLDPWFFSSGGACTPRYVDEPDYFTP